MEILEGCAGWALIFGLPLWLLLGWGVAWPLLAFFVVVVLVQVARHSLPTTSRQPAVEEANVQGEAEAEDARPEQDG